jgi:hypothetical protein
MGHSREKGKRKRKMREGAEVKEEEGEGGEEETEDDEGKVIKEKKAAGLFSNNTRGYRRRTNMVVHQR